jgi:hypothetical protein
MIRIDAMWLAVEPTDMRAGADRLLARVVQVFGSARAHHGYLFANARHAREARRARRLRRVVRGAPPEPGMLRLAPRRGGAPR